MNACGRCTDGWREVAVVTHADTRVRMVHCDCEVGAHWAARRGEPLSAGAPSRGAAPTLSAYIAHVRADIDPQAVIIVDPTPDQRLTPAERELRNRPRTVAHPAPESRSAASRAKVAEVDLLKRLSPELAAMVQAELGKPVAPVQSWRETVGPGAVAYAEGLQAQAHAVAPPVTPVARPNWNARDLARTMREEPMYDEEDPDDWRREVGR